MTERSATSRAENVDGPARGIDLHAVFPRDRTARSVVAVPINALLPADSPREQGVDADHVQRLAEADVPLPPILVHRASMRVIDGMHRLRAAQINGLDTINVTFFDGSEQEAFVLAVKSNIAHGLPLTLADRKSAARRILMSHPEWSDRAIAEASGISHKTVGVIRRKYVPKNSQPAGRMGRDGRLRSSNVVDGRLRASALLKKYPNASAAHIARIAGISRTTVKDVRRRLRRGADPLPRGQRAAPRRGAHQPVDRAVVFGRLRADPSVRLTQAGRVLLRALTPHAGNAEVWHGLADEVPEHLVTVFADLARVCAEDWQQFALRVEERASKDSGSPLK